MILCESTFPLLRVGDRLQFVNLDQDAHYESMKDRWREVTVTVVEGDFSFIFSYDEELREDTWSVRYPAYNAWKWLGRKRVGEIKWFDIWDKKNDRTTS